MLLSMSKSKTNSKESTMSNFPTTPGASFIYRGETYWVLETIGYPYPNAIIAENAYCERKTFYNS